MQGLVLMQTYDWKCNVYCLCEPSIENAMFSVDANLRLKNPIIETLMENFGIFFSDLKYRSLQKPNMYIMIWSLDLMY